MKKPIIILIGGSCASKTTTERYLRSHHGMRPIISLTTRPMREGEANGKDYFFVNESEFRVQDIANFIDIGNGWWYSVPESQLQISEDNEGLVYSVINVEPATQIVRYIKENNLPLFPIAVFFDIPVEDRKQCMKLRGETEENIKIRLSREDQKEFFTYQMSLHQVPTLTYSKRLNPDTQREIAHWCMSQSPTYTKDELIAALWSILDEIDTASDIAKSDNDRYRKMTESLQAKRWQLPITVDSNDKLVVNAQQEYIGKLSQSPTPYYEESSDIEMDTYVSLRPDSERLKLKNAHTVREALVIESILSIFHGEKNTEVTQDISSIRRFKK